MPLMTEHQARQLSAPELAFMGDTVFDLLVRCGLMFSGLSANQMHQAATRVVNARAQAEALGAIRHLLTSEEEDIVRRGRNAHIAHNIPHAASKEEYMDATGFEALLGYLFLTGGMPRAQKLFELSQVRERL